MTTLSAILLSSCGSAPKKPVGFIAGINAEAKEPYGLFFDLEKDFDEDLRLKPDSKGARRALTLKTLHKHWAMDANTKEELVRYAREWKARYIKMRDECELVE